MATLHDAHAHSISEFEAERRERESKCDEFASVYAECDALEGARARMVRRTCAELEAHQVVKTELTEEIQHLSAVSVSATRESQNAEASPATVRFQLAEARQQMRMPARPFQCEYALSSLSQSDQQQSLSMSGLGESGHPQVAAFSDHLLGGVHARSRPPSRMQGLPSLDGTVGGSPRLNRYEKPLSVDECSQRSPLARVDVKHVQYVHS